MTSYWHNHGDDGMCYLVRCSESEAAIASTRGYTLLGDVDAALAHQQERVADSWWFGGGGMFGGQMSATTKWDLEHLPEYAWAYANA